VLDLVSDSCRVFRSSTRFSRDSWSGFGATDGLEGDTELVVGFISAQWVDESF